MKKALTWVYDHTEILVIIAALALGMILLSGCVNVESLNSKLQEGNSTYTLDVPAFGGRVRISRSNPTIGFTGQAGPNGVSHSSSTNLSLAIQYHSMVPTPTMPNQEPTNSIPKK